ncbi:MAG: ribonuclease R [Chitinophaga sp.]|uniref:ribonuclease R n=1 Tax=Chitinophaga sp. TaxID=1869181 RepID=UPI0025BB7085|nr:ribonuclease R [Chitinophaga sp.]MBV8253748.1 ribonuclease R [Chitinophaga sp.]
MSKKKKDKRGGSQNKTYKGVVEVTRSGMAFVIVQGLPRDILVKQKNLNTALDKDEVLVDIIKPARSGSRMEGVITDILKRSKTEFTGTLQVSKNFGFLIPEKGMFMPDIYIPANSLGEAQTGDKAVVKIVAWGEKSRKPVGEIVEILDASNTNDLAMKEILIEAGFPLNFPKEALEELQHIPDAITDAEVRKRRDCREILTFTIDPVDAKDFDDAISIRLLKNGLYEIGVHIADVSHYVLPGTELDKEAEKRANSVYLPDRVLPMLPEKISNELCSLRPHEDKYTFSAIFQMNEQGEVKQHWIGRTVIHSAHRFTYEDVQEIIETNEGPYKQEILLLNKIAQTLRKDRFSKGAINFSSQEVRFKLDETGKPIGIIIKESKEAHQLIEEMMLLANRTVAAYVAKIKVNKQPVPFPYRVHDTPDPEKLKVFASFAHKFGYRFDLSTPDTIARSFNRMLELVKGKPEQHVLETLGIRTMAKAAYTIDNVGHYGLGFDDYCHFTSPIRRYPDVLVHRVLAEALANDIHPNKQMEKECKHCSEMERKAMEAERAANKYKQVEYMQQFIGESFMGVISGVAHFGFWVETEDTKCEGLVSVHNLNKKEEFIFSEAEYALVGTRSGRKFRIGQEVEIRVVAANLAKRQLDYELEEELQTMQPRVQQPRQAVQQQQQHPGKKKKKKDKQRNFIPKPVVKTEIGNGIDMPPIDHASISESILTPPEVPVSLQPDVFSAIVAPQESPVITELTGVVKPKEAVVKPAATKKTAKAKKKGVEAMSVAGETPVAPKATATKEVAKDNKQTVAEEPVAKETPVAPKAAATKQVAKGKQAIAEAAAVKETPVAPKAAATKQVGKGKKVVAEKSVAKETPVAPKAAATKQVAKGKKAVAEKPVAKETPVAPKAAATKQVAKGKQQAVATKPVVKKTAAAPKAKATKAEAPAKKGKAAPKATKAVAKKPAAPKKAVAKKAVVSKPATKKAASTGKTVVAPAKKQAATAKKKAATTVKKAATTKATPKKAAAVKTTAKKAVAKPAPKKAATKATPKKVATKAPAKKAAPKKATGKKGNTVKKKK